MERIKTRSKKIADAVKKIVGLDAPIVSPEQRGLSSTRSAGLPDNLSQRIQEKAYELYLQRGCSSGDAQADWYKAEQLVLAELKGKQ